MLRKKYAWHKNWPQICKLPDPNMRIVLSLCQETAVLAILATMFPQCFTDQKMLPRVPKSAMMWFSRHYAISQNMNPTYQELHAKLMWHPACAHLDLPLERYKRPSGLNKKEEKNVYEQLHGRIPEPAMEVYWHGQKYVTVQIKLRPEETKKPLPIWWQPNNLILTLAEYIDTNN